MFEHFFRIKAARTFSDKSMKLVRNHSAEVFFIRDLYYAYDFRWPQLLVQNSFQVLQVQKLF